MKSLQSLRLETFFILFMQDLLSITPSFYKDYVKRVKGKDVIEAIENQKESLSNFLNEIPEHKFGFKYADNKWSVKEVIQHCIDTERIMSYRALALARGENQSIPGYDEDAYTLSSQAEKRTSKNLIEEWMVVRDATLFLFKSFTQEMMNKSGTCDKKTIHVNVLGAIIVGHTYHHLDVVKQRYL